MASQQKDQLRGYLFRHKVSQKPEDRSNDGKSSEKCIQKSGTSSHRELVREPQLPRERTMQPVKSSIPRTLPPISRSSTSLSSTEQMGQRAVKEKVSERKKLTKCSRKLTVNTLPAELLLKIFGYLSPADLMICSSVCSYWSELANDNVLWRKVLGTYAPKGTKNHDTPAAKVNVPSEYWKTKCISDASKFSTKTILSKLKKVDPFTGLPTATKSVLEQVSMKWVVSFIGYDGDEMKHAFQSDQFHFPMSVCVRWYGVEISSITLSRLRRIQFFAARPVLKDGSGQPLANSPCKRSLLHEVDFRNWTDWSDAHTPICQDDTLLLYSVEGNIVIGVWKNGGDLAFVVATLHKHNLVQSALLGSHSEIFSCARPKFIRNDVDREHGLHGYSCTLELRNLRASLWSEQFTGLFSHVGDLRDGYAQFQLIDPERSYQRSSFEKKVSLPWKTEAFHGKVDGVCILDGTLLDEQSNPMWCFSSPVKFQQMEAGSMYYEYDGKQMTLEFKQVNHGNVIIRCIWEDNTKRYFINDIHIQLSLSHINKWFGTRY